MDKQKSGYSVILKDHETGNTYNTWFLKKEWIAEDATLLRMLGVEKIDD